MSADSLESFVAGINEDGTHLCILDSIGSNESQRDGRKWIIFNYEVIDENSDIEGEELREFYEDFSHLTVDEFKMLPPADKRKVRMAIRRKRDRLESLGVPEENLDGFDDYESLRGLRVHVVVETSTGTKKDPESGKDMKTKYTNIRNVSLAD